MNCSSHCKRVYVVPGSHLVMSQGAKSCNQESARFLSGRLLNKLKEPVEVELNPGTGVVVAAGTLFAWDANDSSSCEFIAMCEAKTKEISFTSQNLELFGDVCSKVCCFSSCAFTLSRECCSGLLQSQCEVYLRSSKVIVQTSLLSMHSSLFNIINTQQDHCNFTSTLQRGSPSTFGSGRIQEL